MAKEPSEEVKSAIDSSFSSTAAELAEILVYVEEQVQKEPADLRILLESGLNVHDAASIKTARDWLTETGVEGYELARLLTKSLRPN